MLRHTEMSRVKIEHFRAISFDSKVQICQSISTKYSLNVVKIHNSTTYSAYVRPHVHTLTLTHIQTNKQTRYRVPLYARVIFDFDYLLRAINREIIEENFF